MTEKEFLEILKRTRKDRKITLSKASELLGIHRNSLSRIERGKIANVKFDFICRYAAILDCEVVLIHRSRL